MYAQGHGFDSRAGISLFYLYVFYLYVFVVGGGGGGGVFFFSFFLFFFFFFFCRGVLPYGSRLMLSKIVVALWVGILLVSFQCI